jgi:hypothetical protein
MRRREALFLPNEFNSILLLATRRFQEEIISRIVLKVVGLRQYSFWNNELSATLNGCQSGDAVVVQSLGGGTSSVTIDNNILRSEAPRFKRVGANINWEQIIAVCLRIIVTNLKDF